MIKTETLRHQKAFDFYYALENKRSFPKVAREFTVSKESIKKWAKSFNWKKRIQQRDAENAKKLEQKTDRIIVDTKANYRQMITDNLKTLKKVFDTAFEVKNGKKQLKINAKTSLDLSHLITAIEKNVKMDLLLLGEATERIEEKHEIDADVLDLLEKLKE